MFKSIIEWILRIGEMGSILCQFHVKMEDEEAEFVIAAIKVFRV
jgi:hypothetical protein